ncbi:MAG: type II toxin-antitoxin system HicA family toxin [Gemmatimonadetes bacterium]|nr:type II toxin-antitoxin system HicA family toxin [Gemmatimonadota bacterium]MXY84002.1 type II toxin-antitoxin system HicA family toxin [Gemmatimonadota bacterium]MYB71239.1 type II toxin-antitoxin system HicA family toxin [Gemmatimonadota bacterium]
MADFSRQVRRLLTDIGCHKVRDGKGSHEIWYSPLTKRHITVARKIKSRHTANHILKESGQEKAF